MEKYGLFKYETENIGDEIQSIAARRFLPQVDYYLDRDELDRDLKNIASNEKIKIIMNGWYTHKPYNWPPKNNKLIPLFVSMFIEQRPGPDYSVDAFLSNESRLFLKKYGPVGTRDKSTFDFFTNNGIDAFFSGCLTLTLVPDKRIKRQDFILLVDVSDRVYDKIKKITQRKIVRINSWRTTNLSTEEKFSLAEYWLSLYQSAHLVVTTRLHCMLPCLALETPVLAISGRDPKRYKGLIDLTYHLSENEFLKTSSFDLDSVSNPNDFRDIRHNLERICKNFTGYDSNKSYLYGKDLNTLQTNPNLISAIGKAMDLSYKIDEISTELVDARDTISKLSSDNDCLRQQVYELKNIGVKDSIKALNGATRRYVKKKTKKHH